MRFRILGPLVVSDGETNVPIPGRVRLRLLAILLLDAGRPIPMSRLVDRLWDDEPPVTAKRQVQNGVAAFRRILGAERITPVGDGYRFNLDGAWVDAVEFDDAVKTARGLAEAGRTQTALATLRSGLGLWRGYPLTGISNRAIDAGASRLDDLRLSAIEDRVELELSTGAAAMSVAELRQVLLDHPYRQRTAAHLMAVLQQDGRTAEALNVFETIKTRLAEDLGLDLDPVLRDRHAAVLGGDRSPTGGNRQAAPPTPTNPVPAQLPAGPVRFIGRADALATLTKQLDDATSARTCVITGAAGVGKTALAVNWAHRVRDRFPDGQLFINLRGFDPRAPVTAEDALARFIRALQGPDAPVPREWDEAAALYRTLTDGKRILVVLDNARDATQVRSLLSSGSGFVLVTSRHRLPGLSALDDAGTVSLGVLGRTESLALAASVIGADRLHRDAAAADQLAERCGDLPLALRIATAHLANHSHDSIADYNRKLAVPNRLDHLTIDGDPAATVITALDHSLRVLDPDARKLFCLLGLVPGDDFPGDLAVAIGGLGDSATERLVDRLESAHLVEQHVPGRYRFHDLVREYAVRCATTEITDGDRRAVADRFIDWHYDFRAEPRPVEESNILAACQEFRSHPKMWRLVAPLVHAVSAGRHHVGLKDALEAAYANAESHDDALGQYQITNTLVTYHLVVADHATAIETARRAAQIATRLDTGIMAKAKRTLGMAFYATGNLVEAESNTRQALALSLGTMDWRELFDCRFGLFNMCRNLGKYSEADALLTELAVQLDGEDSPDRAMLLNYGKASLFLAMGSFDRASTAADDALAIAESLAQPRWEALALLVRGESRRRRGNATNAKSDLLRALDTARQVKYRAIEYTVLRELVILSVRTGELRQSIGYAEKLAAERSVTQTQPIDNADIALALSVVRTATGEHRAGAHHAERAVVLNEIGPHVLALGRSYRALADAQEGLGELDAARDNRNKALDIFTRLDVPESVRTP